MDYIIGLVILVSLITLGYVFLMFRRINKIKISSKKNQEITSYIQEGAMAFLKREYKIMGIFLILMAVVLVVLGLIPSISGNEGSVGWKTAVCFVIGAFLSGLTGFIGMYAATKSNGKTAEMAHKEGMPGALQTAFSGGAILGLSVSAIGILGLSLLFFIFYKIEGLNIAVKIVNGYAVGCSMIALFARVGGGIYTKAADVGADLVGKVEAGIPEDDPRNPAVIADNVGDNVGDVAGMGSDLCESYVGSIISSLALAVVSGTGVSPEKNVIFVLLIVAIGLIASLLSTIIIRSKKWTNPQKTLSFATYIATGIVIVGAALLSIFYLGNGKGEAGFNNIGAFISVVVGLIAGILVGEVAEIYTSSDFKQVKEIAKESQTGHATNIISGFGSGMQSTCTTIIILGLGIVIAFLSYNKFGIGLAAVGMLCTVGITVSVDAYGPISDNAGGIAQMSGLPEEVRKITDKLDSVGNTTAAIGKGFSIGSATFTALALFVAYGESVGLSISGLNLLRPEVIVCLLVGAMLPYLFSALTIKSVGKAANKMIEEVRSQFKNDPGIMEGTSKPNYARCVDISTSAALKEMVVPGCIAILAPIVVGLVFGKYALGGLLIGGLSSAIMLAVFMANAGGAWDNAKKFIEEGHFGGKGSETHKTAVTGDTVGDPLKDTAGPSMNILVKLMSVIALIIAPILASPSFTSLWELICKWLDITL